MISRVFSLRNGIPCFPLHKLGSWHHYTCQAADPAYRSESEDDIDWDNLGFNPMPADYMYITKCSRDGHFEQGEVTRYGNIELSPAAAALNYGQGVFEGTKAYRQENGRVVLFRPEVNAVRMQMGAERLCMPAPSVDQFVDAVKQTAVANRRWVPPPGKGSLYIRPLLIGSGPVLGVGPSPEYTFLVYASPVGFYFKDGSAPLSLVVEDHFDRASPRGTGGVKAICNYAPIMKGTTRARSRGFGDVVYLDSVHKRNIEEASTSNIFIVKNNVVITPGVSGTILPGVTRRSVIEIAEDRGYGVEERAIAVEELTEADEVFCTGTAVVMVAAASVTYKDKRFELKTGAGTVGQEMYEALTQIQMGVAEDKYHWTIQI